MLACRNQQLQPKLVNIQASRAGRKHTKCSSIDCVEKHRFASLDEGCGVGDLNALLNRRVEDFNLKEGRLNLDRTM